MAVTEISELHLFPTCAFEDLAAEAFPYRYRGQLQVRNLAGGIPADPNVAASWIKTKLGGKDDLIRELVAQTMVERGIDLAEATKEVNERRHTNGFKRDPESGELFIEGRQLKSALKEAVSVAVAAGKLKPRGWGSTNKGLLSFLSEHVFVVEDWLYLGVTEPTGVNQRFVSTWRGTGIQYEEFIESATINFQVISDFEFSRREWGMVWLTGQQQGVGASRSQGFGRYVITRWERIAA